MENTETSIPSQSTTSVTVELSSEQYAFLTKWQKTHEQELGIEVPVGAMVRKAVDIAMKSEKAKDERPARSDRPSGGRSFGDKPGFKPGMRKPFGGHSDSPSRGTPRFGTMMGIRNKKPY